MASSRTSEIALWLDAQLPKAWLPNLFAALSRDERLDAVESAWHKVRRELTEVGLLYDAGEEGDGYLDQIELEVTALPSIRASGFVFDVGVGRIWKMVGFEEGFIYLMADTPHVAYAPGYTLTDVIRHEYAHAWYWLEPDFVDAPWFRKAFGASYLDYGSPLEAWLAKSQIDLQPKSTRFKTEFRNQFVSVYAASAFCEDFAETFMFYLRCRNSLHRFKNRPGVFRKLKAVESAVRRARKATATHANYCFVLADARFTLHWTRTRFGCAPSLKELTVGSCLSTKALSIAQAIRSIQMAYERTICGRRC